MIVSAPRRPRAHARIGAALIGAALAGCSASGASRAHEVDLNAAAQAAEADIARYAAIRHDHDRRLMIAADR